MRFAGLFDCANLKAHGEAILIYDNNFRKDRKKIILRAASSNSTESSYKNSAKERLPLLNPLNYASNVDPCSESKASKKDKKCNKKSEYVSITELESLETSTGNMEYTYQQ